MIVNQIVLVIWIHTLADFFLQTRTMGTKKSSSLKWLGMHVLVYSLPLLYFGWKFAIIQGVLHFIVDYFTSRWGKWAYENDNMYLFWGIIGLDQAIHLTCLISGLVL
jgi:hypothetical protein